MSYTPKTVLLIEWPNSQRIMEHPEARPVDDDDNPNCYIIPWEIWNKYKNTYYTKNESDNDTQYSDEDNELFEIEQCNNCSEIIEGNWQICECNLNICDDCTICCSNPVCDSNIRYCSNCINYCDKCNKILCTNCLNKCSCKTEKKQKK